MPNRIYFHDEHGNELDTPFSGRPHGWLGAGLSTRGRPMCDEPDGAEFELDDRARITRSEISLHSYSGPQRFLTIEDFPGHARVLVKVRYSGDPPEWFWLGPGPTPIRDRHAAAGLASR